MSRRHILWLGGSLADSPKESTEGEFKNLCDAILCAECEEDSRMRHACEARENLEIAKGRISPPPSEVDTRLAQAELEAALGALNRARVEVVKAKAMWRAAIFERLAVRVSESRLDQGWQARELMEPPRWRFDRFRARPKEGSQIIPSKEYIMNECLLLEDGQPLERDNSGFQVEREIIMPRWMKESLMKTELTPSDWMWFIELGSRWGDRSKEEWEQTRKDFSTALHCGINLENKVIQRKVIGTRIIWAVLWVLWMAYAAWHGESSSQDFGPINFVLLCIGFGVIEGLVYWFRGSDSDRERRILLSCLSRDYSPEPIAKGTLPNLPPRVEVVERAIAKCKILTADNMPWMCAYERAEWDRKKAAGYW